MKLFFALLLFPFLCFAQVKYGKVDKSEFESIALSGEKDVDAVVLYRQDRTTFTESGMRLFQTNSVHERILIKTEEGLEYATQKFLLYKSEVNNRYDENLNQVKASAYNLVNGEIQETKLRRKDIFEEDLNEYWRSESFTIPGAKVGSIIEFKYKKVSYLSSIDDKVIQYDIPINELDLSVTTSEFFTYNVSGNPQSTFLNGKMKSGSKDQIKYKRLLSSNDRTFSVHLAGIPALADEPYSGNKDLYRAKFVFELSGKSIPGQIYESYTNTWEEISKSIYKHENFGGQLGSFRVIKKSILENISSTELTIQNAYAILDFLKSKVKWNGHYGKYAEMGVKNAYRDGVGNSADINLLLINILNQLDFTAYPVLVSTQNNGIPLYPTLNGFNYVIADLVFEDKHYLIDATEKYGAMNVLPERSAHWLGRILYNSENSDWIDLEPKFHSKDILVINASMDDDQFLSFTAKRRLTRKTAMILRSSFEDKTAEDINKYLEGDESGLKVSGHQLDNIEKSDEPLDLSYSGIYENGVQKIGEKLYINPLLYNGTDENLFKSETRQLPIDFRMPMESKTIANITIPEGYEVQTLPQSIKSVYQDGVGSYSFLISQRGNRITTISEFKLDNPLIMPEDYQAFREFFIAIVNKDAEKIILNKKS